jgi:hypothetical protein
MLRDGDAQNLKQTIRDKLGAAEADTGVYLRATWKRKLETDLQGILTVTNKRVVFCAHAVLDGEIWRSWPAEQISGMELQESLLGRELHLHSADGNKVFKELAKQELSPFVSALEALGAQDDASVVTACPKTIAERTATDDPQATAANARAAENEDVAVDPRSVGHRPSTASDDSRKPHPKTSMQNQMLVIGVWGVIIAVAMLYYLFFK